MSWFMAQVGTIRPTLEATGWARPAATDLGRVRRQLGNWIRLRVWRGRMVGDMVASVVGPYHWGWRHHFDYDHVSLNHVNIYHHWDQRSRTPNTGTDSTRGTVGNGRTIGAALQSILEPPH